MKIITSTSAHDAYFRTLDDMKAALKEGFKLRIIAPDRFTASVERGLLLTLGEQSSFDIEVMSFTRMADKYIGAGIKKCLTPEGSVMLIGRVIDDCLKTGRLTYYNKAAGKDGFASELYAALTAIRNSGISSDKLQEAADRASSNAMKRKLCDIVTIYKGYLAALEGKHSDSTTRLEQLAKYIGENPSQFAGIHFFCTDINEFSEPEYAVLKALANSAGRLTVGMESGKGNPNARIYPHRVIKRLVSLAGDKATVCEYRDESMSEALKIVSSHLFSYLPAERKADANGKVRIRVAKDRGDEVLRLALDILAHVRGGGRFKNFEVYASDISDYENEIKSVFGRYGIPFFIDRRAPLAEQTKTRYLLDAVACIRSGFATRETLDFVKNPLFEFQVDGGQDSVFEFENFVLEHCFERVSQNVKFDDFTQKGEFICSKFDDKPHFENKFAPEEVRKRLFDVLSPFISAGSGALPIGEFVVAARKLLEGADEASKRHAERLSELSAYYVKCAEQVDGKLGAVLDEIEDVLDYETDIAGFESVLAGMFKTLKISLVPTYLDCVFVGDGDSRFMGDGKIYALGATNDKFPKISPGGAVINVHDEEILDKLGVPIMPNSADKAYAEMFKALDLIKKPRGGVIISYPESGGTSLLRRSTVIDELQGLLRDGDGPLETERIDFSDLSRLSEVDVVNLLLTEKGAGHLALSRFGRAGYDVTLGSAYECMGESDRAHMKPRMLPERVTLRNGAFAKSTSVSRLETFFACPYRHYMQYVLSLKKRKEGELESTDNGIILHGVLERFFKCVKEGEVRSRDDIRPIAESAFDEEIKRQGLGDLLTKPQTARLLARVKEEGARVCEKLYDIYLRSDFKPILLEAHIEDFGTIKVKYGDDEALLKGTIDRVDEFDGKFIVIDYKSYKSADLDLNDVYFGKKLQLYIYMYATEHCLGLEPAGVFYLPIYDSYGKEGETRLQYRGHASDDEGLLAHMDSAIGETECIVPLVKNKKGELNKNKHLSARTLKLVGEYAYKLAGEGARQIAEGYIKPSPISCDDFCDYYDICAYKDICQNRVCSGATLASFETGDAKEDEGGDRK